MRDRCLGRRDSHADQGAVATQFSSSTRGGTSTRHTFASLLLQQGESPAYVQRQLGHASIQLTVGTYGKWLPMGNKAAVNRLDDESGSKVVAKTATGTSGVLEVPVNAGGPSRTRTLDPLIKSQLLYQLS